MHLYCCNRCGKQFGCRQAVQLHLKNKHFDKDSCFYCGEEVLRKSMQAHICNIHPTAREIPSIYKQEPKTKRIEIRNMESEKGTTFWQDSGDRFSCFVAPCTEIKCRLCGKKMAGVHGREQHERDVHHFTSHIKHSLALRLKPWNMLSYLKPRDVTAYLRKDLKSCFSDKTECFAQINILVDFLRAEVPYEITHVVRGGSFGKQTCLKEHSDLDLVLFIKDCRMFGGSAATIGRMKTCLNKVKEILQDSFLTTRILITETTSHSLRFQYQCHKHDHVHHVDLMPCNDLLGSSPTQREKLSLFELIANCRSQHELQLFNASVIQLQVEFVRNQPPVVHDLIRLVKHWKRSSFGPTESLAK